MARHFFTNLILVCALFVPLRSATATTIGNGQTVDDYTLAGQNINFNSTLTKISDGTDPTYATGAALVSLTQDFTRSLGTGANQVQWQASGGFTRTQPGLQISVNIGDQSPPATLVWGQGGFVPDDRTLVLGNINFANNIDLGTDPSKTRKIDIGYSLYEATTFEGAISGAGNLTMQGYGIGNYYHVAIGNYPYSPASINVTGRLTVSNVYLELLSISASSLNLEAHTYFLNELTSSPDVTMDGGSFWIAVPLDGSTLLNQSVGKLTCKDPASLIGVGAIVSGVLTSTALTVHDGYFAGHIYDALDKPYPHYGGSLIKDGPGFFTLAADNSDVGTPGSNNYYQGYSQGTTVKQGTLLCMNTTGSATGTGPITVMSGASLGGPGIVAPTGSSSVAVQAGGLLDLRAYDPEHIPTLAEGIFQAHLNPANNLTFQSGAGLGFILASGGRSTMLHVTGLTANLPQVFFNNNAVSFRALNGTKPGTYTLITFDQPGAYYGTLAPGPGYTFIYQPQAILVQVTTVP